MTRIVWTHQAIQVIDAIRTYIGRDSPRYAARVVEEIIEAVDRLVSFPSSGRVVPELRDENVRAVILGHFRIVHRVTAEEAQVLTVLPAAPEFGVP